MKRIIWVALILMLGSGFQSFSQGDLLITPTRVVFEGDKQKEELNLVNMGKDTAIYSISFVQYNMKEDGSYVIIKKPDSGQRFAEPYLRIFPRKVSIAPGEPQVIMLQCRRKTDMLPGEYRAYLYFRSEKNYMPLGTKNSDTTKLTIQLIPVYGVCIPVIIRSGAGKVSVALSGLKLGTLQDTIPYLNLTINRTGNISVFGDITIEYIPVQGNAYEIGKVRGVKVYTDIDKLNVSIKLNKTPGLTFNNGKLVVRYTSPEEAKYVVYSEGELDLKQ